MKRLLERDILLRLVAVLLLAPLLGFAARSHQVRRSLNRAYVKWQSGAPSEAAKQIAQAAERMPWREDLWCLAGHNALQAGEPEAAIDYLKRAFSISDSLSPQGWLDLGDAYWQTDDSVAALEAWKQALAAGKVEEESLKRLGHAYSHLGDYLAAISSYQALLELRPDDANLHYRLGLLVASRDPEAALDDLMQAEDLDSSLASRIAPLRRSIMRGRASDNPAYQLLITGQGLATLQEWELAAQAFELATQVSPQYSEAWAYLGESLQHLDHDGEQVGLAELQTALELDPQSVSAHMFLALYLTRQRDYERALEILQRAAELDADNPVVYVEIGNALAASGDLAAAQQSYEKAIQLAPQDPEYYRRLAEFSLKYDYLMQEIALPAARRAVIMADQDPKNLDLMAQVLIQQGDLLNAEKFLTHALQLDPTYAPIHLHFAVLYLLWDRDAEAHQELIKTLELKPDELVKDQVQRLLETYFP